MHARRAHYTHNEADPAPCLSEHRLAGPGSAKLDDGELTLGRGAVGNVGNMVADLEVLELGNDAIGARAIRREQEPVGPPRAQCNAGSRTDERPCVSPAFPGQTGRKFP